LSVTSGTRQICILFLLSTLNYQPDLSLPNLAEFFSWYQGRLEGAATHTPAYKMTNGNLAPASWDDAIVTVEKMLDCTPADNIAAEAGGLCGGEVSF
jgi:hypothetical protein